MSKEMTIMALWMMSAAVCVPFLIMAVVWLKSGVSPYGMTALPAVESEVQKAAMADLSKRAEGAASPTEGPES
jgi:hypothetical protein